MSTPHTSSNAQLLQTAVAAFQAGRLDEAQRHCRNLLERSPEDPAALQLQGRLAFEHGDSEAALNWFEQSAQYAPDNPELHCDLALVYAHGGNTDAAEKNFERALQLSPQLLQARLQLASIVHRNGQLEKALGHYKLALEQAPQLPELHCQIGICEFQRGDLDLARHWFESCLNLDPEHLDALENLGCTELGARRFDQAEKYLLQVLQRAPQRAQAHHLLGFVRLHQGQIEAAAQAFLTPVKACFAIDSPGGEEPADATLVTATKLRHDLEQLNYLAERNLLAPELSALPQQFNQALADLPDSSPQQFFFKRPDIPSFKTHYNKLLEDFRPAQIPGGALNPNLDLDAIEARFKQQGWVYFDHFLNPAALAALQEFCQRSSIWFEKKFQYEVGASLRNGFCCPLLLQIGEELRQVFPEIFGRHLFSGCFSYKYYQQGVDGHIHADRGAVSLNFWPTDDAANLDPQRGGLVIWNKRVNADYFYASPEQIDAIHERMVNASDATPATIPYRCNRAMLFYSDVLHRSDRMKFKEGYQNRRVSITYLYGQPGQAGSPAASGC